MIEQWFTTDPVHIRALFFILLSQVNCLLWLTKSFSTSRVYLAIPWAKQAFFFVSFLLRELTVCLLRRVFHTQFSRSLATGVLFLSFHSNVLPLKRKWNSGRLRLLSSFISSTHPSLTWHRRENAQHMWSPSLQPASASLKSTDNKVRNSFLTAWGKSRNGW